MRRKRGGRSCTGGGGEGKKGGEPCAKGVCQRSKPPQIKLLQFQHLLWSLSSPQGSRPVSQEIRSRKPGGGKSRSEGWASAVTQPRSPHRWLRKRRQRPRAPPGSGAESRLSRDARTNNLKWQRRPLRHPPLTGTAQNSLRRRTPAGRLHLRRSEGGEKTGGSRKLWVVIKEEGKKSRRRFEQAFKRVTL